MSESSTFAPGATAIVWGLTYARGEDGLWGHSGETRPSANDAFIRAYQGSVCGCGDRECTPAACGWVWCAPHRNHEQAEDACSPFATFDCHTCLGNPPAGYTCYACGRATTHG